MLWLSFGTKVIYVLKVAYVYIDFCIYFNSDKIFLTMQEPIIMN